MYMDRCVQTAAGEMAIRRGIELIAADQRRTMDIIVSPSRMCVSGCLAIRCGVYRMSSNHKPDLG